VKIVSTRTRNSRVVGLKLTTLSTTFPRLPRRSCHTTKTSMHLIEDHLSERPTYALKTELVTKTRTPQVHSP